MSTSFENGWQQGVEAVKEDPYRLLAALLFNVKPEEVTDEQRQCAKQQMYIEIYSASNSLHKLSQNSRMLDNYRNQAAAYRAMLAVAPKPECE